MRSYVQSLMKDNEVTKVMEVSEFLNQVSPTKPLTKRKLDNIKGDSSITVFNKDSNSDEGLAVKLEMIDEVTQKSAISVRKSNRLI